MTAETLYSEVEREIAALIEGLDDPVAAMASCAAVLHGRLEQASWTGFYRVVPPGKLLVGPYQGPPACLEIPFGRGVCGAAVRLRETQVVADVHSFEGHVVCDPLSRSEIVVPLFGRDGEVVGVLDVDSHQPDAFDDADRQGLERIVRLLAPALGA